MKSDQVFWILLNLHAALLHIIVKVPCDHRNDSFLVVLHFDLQPIFVDCLNNFDYFKTVSKVCVHVSYLFAINFVENEVGEILLSLKLFLVWDELSKFDVLASMNNYEVVFSVDTRAHQGVRLTFKDQKLLNEVFILRVVK